MGFWSFSALSQVNTPLLEDNREEGGYKNRVDLTFLIVPATLSNLEYYKVCYNKKINEYRWIGADMSIMIAELKYGSFDRSIQSNFSLGYSWSLFPKRKVYCYPNLSLIYSMLYGRVDTKSYHGLGISTGLNFGYRFDHFGIGAHGRTNLTAGGRKDLINGSFERAFDMRWVPLEYGLNLTYRF